MSPCCCQGPSTPAPPQTSVVTNSPKFLRNTRIPNILFGRWKFNIWTSNNKHSVPTINYLIRIVQIICETLPQTGARTRCWGSAAYPCGNSWAPQQTPPDVWWTGWIIGKNKFHIHQCQAQIEIWRSPDIPLTFTWTSPDHLTIIWPSPDPYKTIN